MVEHVLAACGLLICHPDHCMNPRKNKKVSLRMNFGSNVNMVEQVNSHKTDNSVHETIDVMN